jgi:hypothetical protein
MADDILAKPTFYDIPTPEQNKKPAVEENPEIEGDYINLSDNEGEIRKVLKEDAPLLINRGNYKPLNEQQKKRIVLEKKFGSTGQEFLTGIEGAADSVSFSLINRAENAIGEHLNIPEITTESQEARKLVNPKAALTGEALGTTAMILGTSGFGGAGAAAAARVGLGAEAAGLKAAETITKFGIKAGINAKKVSQLAAMARVSELAKYSTLSRIGAKAVANAVEGAIYASGQEAVKTIFKDPNQSLGSAATNIGLYGLLGGGVTGAAFAGAGELWNAKFGKQVGASIDDIKSAIQRNVEKSKADTVANTVINQGIKLEGELIAGEPTAEVKYQIPGEKPNANEIREASNRLKVELPKGTTEADPIVGQKASVIADSDTWEGNKLRKQQLEANKRIQEILDEDLFGERLPAHVEAYDVGKDAQNSLVEELVNKETGKKTPVGILAKLKAELSKRYDTVMKHFDVIDLSSDIKARAKTAIENDPIIKNATNDAVINRVSKILEKFSSDDIKNLSQLKEFNTNEINKALLEAQRKGDEQLINALKVIKKSFKQVRAEGIKASAVEIAGREGQEIADKFLQEVTTLDKDYANYKKQIIEFLDETNLGPGDYAGDLQTLVKKLKKTKAEDIGKKLLNVKDRDQILYLKQKFPDIFENLRKFKIKEIYEKAKSTAQGSDNKILFRTISDEFRKMGPAMTDIIFPDKKQLIQDLSLLYVSSPQIFNPPKSAVSLTYLGYLGKKFFDAQDKTALTKTVLNEMGSWGKNFLTENLNTLANLAKSGGDDQAADVALTKILANADRDTNAAGFKIMTDYIRQVLKGEVNTSKAIENLMKGAPIVIPQHLKPDEKTKEKLDKRVKKMGENPTAMLDTHQDFNHYMGDHGMAIAAASANAVNYLNTIRPIERKESPLDDPTPPSAMEKQNYDVALSVAQQPLMILEEIKEGTLNSQKLGHLQNLYPDFYANMRLKMMNQLVDVTSKGEKIPYKTRMGLSLFLGTPLDSTMKPEGIMALQPKMAQAQQQAMMPMQQATQGGGRQRGSMKNIGKLADQQLTPMQTRIMEKQSGK